MLNDSPGKRLALFRDEQKLSQAALALSLGVARSSIAFIETDARPPTRSFLQKISERYNISADWLLNGHGEMMHAPEPGFRGRIGKVEPPTYEMPGHGDLRFENIDYAFARRMDLSDSAGNGLVPIDDGEAERIALPMSWYARHSINSDLSVLVKVKGDSMATAIPDGALVLVHVIEKLIGLPGIYAFTRDGEAFVKRLLPSGTRPDGRPDTVVILSDNPAYPPIAISGSALNSLRIVGRVRAVLTTF